MVGTTIIRFQFGYQTVTTQVETTIKWLYLDILFKLLRQQLIVMIAYLEL